MEDTQVGLFITKTWFNDVFVVLSMINKDKCQKDIQLKSISNESMY